VTEGDLGERVRTLAGKYTDEAEVYHRVWAPTLRDFAAPFLERLPEDATALLDVGAGVGAVLEVLRRRFPEATLVGIDRSEGMIARAGRVHGRAVADAQALPLRDHSFDIVTMLFMLFHLADPDAALAASRRVLRPGGVIATATWGPEEHWPQLDTWHDLLDEYGAPPAEGILSRHELTDHPDKIAALLSRAGFEDVEVWTETPERTWDTDSFVDFAAGMAQAKRRLDSLAPDRREDFLSRARAELDKLPVAARVHRTQTVLGLGHI